MIYITGDTHGDLSHFKDPKLKRLGEKDIVIVCGDFGFLWNPNDSKEKRNLEWLKKRKYTICFLDGAHENFDMLDSYTPYRWKGGNTHKIADNIYHLMRGEMFISNQNRIVFSATAQYLKYAADLLVTSDDRVQLTATGSFIQVDGILFE